MTTGSKTNRFQVWPLVVLILGVGGFVAMPPRVVAPAGEAAPLLDGVEARPVDRTTEFAVEPGESISEVLTRAAVEARELPGLLLSLREYIDPRRIRPRTPVLVSRWIGDDSPRAVEVRMNRDSTIRLMRGTLGWRSEVRVTPVVVDTVFIETEVEAGRSLYAALVDHDEIPLPPEERRLLVAELAEIYGYKLDFIHDVHAGDRFRFVYEREARPDGTARRGRILVAEVINRSVRHEAFFYNPRGDGGDYFDETGTSLKRAFRRYPVDFVRVTSSFAWSRYHPVLKRSRPHVGTDFGASRGTPVRTTADGTVIFAGRRGGYGNLVEIRHFSGYTTRYAHLSRFAPRARPGMRVEQGEVVGYVGATGLATAAHLHYELRRHGNPLNPRTVRLPSAPPVPEELTADFQQVVELNGALLARYAGSDPSTAGPSIANDD